MCRGLIEWFQGALYWCQWGYREGTKGNVMSKWKAWTCFEEGNAINSKLVAGYVRKGYWSPVWNFTWMKAVRTGMINTRMAWWEAGVGIFLHPVTSCTDDNGLLAWKDPSPFSANSCRCTICHCILSKNYKTLSWGLKLVIDACIVGRIRFVLQMIRIFSCAPPCRVKCWHLRQWFSGKIIRRKRWPEGWVD